MQLHLCLYKSVNGHVHYIICTNGNHLASKYVGLYVLFLVSHWVLSNNNNTHIATIAPLPLTTHPR